MFLYGGLIMFCGKCGAQLLEGSNFCGKCGTETVKEVIETPIETKPKKKPIAVIIAISAVLTCAVLGVAIWLTVSAVGKENLRNELMRDWSRVEEDNGSYYTLVLDFSEDEIEYDFDSLYVDTNIATYKYTVVSSNQFKVDGRSTVYTVEFNDDKEMMTVTPALTSTDDYEYWFNFN